MAGDIPFEFRPRETGLTKVLGDLETDVMEVTWRLRRVTVRDVHRHLAGRRPLAYTTVMTTMTRLAQKGLLEREQERNYYVYRPALSREEFRDKVARTVLDGLLEEFARPVLSHLVERLGTEDEARLRELEEVIRRRRSAEPGSPRSSQGAAEPRGSEEQTRG
ncbi:MAG: BlaI/MecI/CopY family transcriptional regulator [Bacillota bacterium]|nr:BlaI/MecI/CopY family transcriptional regulator [Bacillota bacterium]